MPFVPLETARHCAPEQVTASNVSPSLVWAAVQGTDDQTKVEPPSVVRRTAPSSPTATHLVAEGHETAFSVGPRSVQVHVPAEAGVEDDGAGVGPAAAAADGAVATISAAPRDARTHHSIRPPAAGEVGDGR